jgi:predicted GIY-YIG superfamily endonuclease
MDSWTVYILRCSDATTYAGCTNDFDDRLNRHEHGYVHFTKSRLPVSVIVTIEFRDKYKAYNFEKYLKSGSGRAFMKKHLV